MEGTGNYQSIGRNQYRSAFSEQSSVASTGSSLRIRLTSDESVTDSGFTAVYQCSDGASDLPPTLVDYLSDSSAGSGPDSFHSTAPTPTRTQFEMAAAADSFYHDSFPAFAIELSESVVRDEAVTLHYGVRMWSSHHFQRFEFLRSSVAPVQCGSTPQCTFQRQVDVVSGTSSRARAVEDGVSETREDEQLRKIISAVSNSVMRTVVGPNASLSNTVVPMPEFTYWSSRRSANSGDTQQVRSVWLIMYPLLTMLLIPTLTAMLASEKENGLLDMIKMEGCRVESFFLGNWAFVFGYSFAFTGLFVLTMEISGAVEGESIVRMPGWPVFKLLVLWAHAQTGFVHFLGTVTLSKSRHAALFGAFCVIISTMCGWLLTMLEANHEIAAAPLPGWCLMIPPLAYVRTVGVMLWYGAGEEFERGTWYLALDGFLYFAVAIGYSLWPEGGGRLLIKRLRPESDAAAPCTVTNVVSTGGGTPFASEDESVIAESEHAANLAPGGAAILIKGLVKDFSAVSNGKTVTKRAINELSLAVHTGECFGLLGPNGAGKTTTLEVLTGLVTATSGSASVCGFDVATDMGLVKRVIGVCPQSDVFFADMTVRQHLAFYSLLRGMSRKRIDVEARRLAEKMELDGDSFNKLASTLSGGAKRRLSIAIALAGKPPVIFLDEPTTGLDHPETRRQIWRIIKSEQESRCIVITTHSVSTQLTRSASCDSRNCSLVSG